MSLSSAKFQQTIFISLNVVLLTALHELGGHTPNGFEHVVSGVRFSEIGRATQRFGGAARVRIIMGGDEDDGCSSAYGGKSLGQLDAGHSPELDVEDEATELRMLPVREKRFR